MSGHNNDPVARWRDLVKKLEALPATPERDAALEHAREQIHRWEIGGLDFPTPPPPPEDAPVSGQEREMQSDWFIREVKRCREIGMPLGCCDLWPECSHVLAWVDEREDAAAPDGKDTP